MATITETIEKKEASYQLFINSLKADATKVEYSRLLRKFAKWRKTENLDDLLLLDPKVLRADIIKYVMELKAKNLAFSTRNRVLAAIKHFCSMNELELNWQLIFKFLGEREPTNEDRGYTHEEIAKLIAVADRKWKAILYLMCSSGLRVGAISDLKYGDLSTMQIEGHNIFKITIYRNTTSEHYSFCTPEAYNAIMEYLDYRERCGEVLTNDSPLFRIDFDADDLEQVQNPKTMKYKTFKNKVRVLLIKAGLYRIKPGDNKHRNQVAANHAFRKFFATQLENADVGDFHIEALLGHITGLRGTYRKTPEKRLMEYVKAIDMLTINEENRLRLMVKTLSQEKDQKIQQLVEYQNTMQDQMNVMRQEMDDILHIKRNLVKGELLRTINRGGKEIEVYATNEKDCKIFREKNGGAEHLLKLGPTNVLGEVVSEEDINAMIRNGKDKQKA